MARRAHVTITLTGPEVHALHVAASECMHHPDIVEATFNAEQRVVAHRAYAKLGKGRRSLAREGGRLMGETRDPRLGTWCVFEGDEPVGTRTPHPIWDGPPPALDSPITWPITFRVMRIDRDGDGQVVVVDVEVDEQLQATVKREVATLGDEPEIAVERAL